MTTNSPVHIPELRRNRTILKRFRDWQRWKLWFPLSTLFLLYPLYKFVGAGEEFIHAFGHGDLLLFSALILIELSVEATHINQELEGDVSDRLEGFIEYSKFFGLILILVYGALKFMVDHQSKIPTIASEKVKAYCIASISVTFLVVTFSIFAFWKTLGTVVGCEKQAPPQKEEHP